MLGRWLLVGEALVAKVVHVLDERLDLCRRGSGGEQNARWRTAMPVCLAPCWEAALGDDGVGDHQPLMSPLCAALPDVRTRITALYRWFGASAGPWSGFPSYEEVTENLLLLYQTADLVAAAEASVDDVAALEGAATRLGTVAFFGLFMPATVVGVLHLAHFNWSTHGGPWSARPHRARNLDHGLYRVGNALWHGIYFHANHHRRPGLFDPRALDGGEAVFTPDDPPR